MKIPKRVTLEWLERHGACPTPRQQFGALFPDGVEVSLAAVEKLTTEQHAFVLDNIGWFGARLGLTHNYDDPDQCFCNGPDLITRLRRIGVK